MAVPPLLALVDAGFEIALVVTRADKRRGRGSALIASPVKAAALGCGLPVTHIVDDSLLVEADLGVVVAFGQLIKPPLLARLPLINIHFSLLPRWRGAAPVERAILAGDATTGVCLMRLEEGLDTGPVFDRVEVEISPTASAQDLREQLVAVGVEQLLRNLSRGLGPTHAQQGEPTYAAKLRPEEFEIDWRCSAQEINRLIRLGVAFCTFRGRRLKVLGANVVEQAGQPATFAEPDLVGCAVGSLRLVIVQPEGKAAMPALAWANGARPTVGEQMNESGTS